MEHWQEHQQFEPGSFWSVCSWHAEEEAGRGRTVTGEAAAVRTIRHGDERGGRNRSHCFFIITPNQSHLQHLFVLLDIKQWANRTNSCLISWAVMWGCLKKYPVTIYLAGGGQHWLNALLVSVWIASVSTCSISQAIMPFLVSNAIFIMMPNSTVFHFSDISLRWPKLFASFCSLIDYFVFRCGEHPIYNRASRAVSKRHALGQMGEERNS